MAQNQELRDQYNSSKFWLEFAIFNDGLDSEKARSMSTHTCFPQFSLLPTELRLKIWNHLIQPRVVLVCCFERENRLAERREEHARRAGKSDIPVLLHISRETRELALAHYELTFSWKISALLSDTPVARPAQTWFNFALDALYLTGELEAYDSYGFNSPMVYFLRREDTRRVRHIACPFRELHYPEQESDQIFGCLWHIVDRFHATRRLLLTVLPGDGEGVEGCVLLSTENVIQKIWNGWICGMTVTSSSLADKQIVMVREEDLADAISGDCPQ